MKTHIELLKNAELLKFMSGSTNADGMPVHIFSPCTQKNSALSLNTSEAFNHQMAEAKKLNEDMLALKPQFEMELSTNGAISTEKKWDNASLIYINPSNFLINGVPIHELVISEKLIKKMHTAIVNTGEPDALSFNPQTQKMRQVTLHPGHYRNAYIGAFIDEKTGWTVFTAPEKIPAQMHHFCCSINEQIRYKNPLEFAILAFFNLICIHPFENGNGRLSRILLNLILIKAGFTSMLFENENPLFRKQYIDALQNGHHGNLFPFVDFIMTTLIEQQKELLGSKPVQALLQ